MYKSVVFCTTCKNRTQHLSSTLPKNLADNTHGKFVVLDYNSQDNLQSYLKLNHKPDIESGRLVVYSMLPREDGYVYPFKMAHAKNMAHRCGMLECADILVNLDADGYTGHAFDDYILEKFNSNENIFMQAMWNRWVDREDGSKEWLTQDADGEFGPPVPKGSNGRMVITTNAFLKAGGYDEKYETWSADDKNFNIRLRRLGQEPKLLERRFHDTILHNNKMRFREYPQAATLMNESEFKINVHDSDETIANFGNIGCGVVYRNFDFSTPITLSPLPTRIFGIGLHKTGTTSLHTALSILGYDSAHWTTAHWAKAIWNEMKDGKSPTLEKHYALCDLPISVLYRELDAFYPGSKFILTVRDENQWLESVRRHWGLETNPYRQAWDTDPFSHFIHRHIYGINYFHDDVFLARYRRHNAEVKEYFKYRPDDLLIFNAKDGWKKLCKWLDKPVPDVMYPKVNTSLPVDYCPIKKSNNINWYYVIMPIISIIYVILITILIYILMFQN